MKTILVLLSLAFFLTGCGNVLNSYVAGVKPPTYVVETPIAPPGNLDLEGKIGIKVSPGSVISKSPHLGMKAGVTLTQKAAVSDSLGARIGINRSPARF